MKTENTNCTVVVLDGKILLTRRAGKNFHGWWCFPGGHEEKGETHQRAAQREANEEVGEVTIEENPFLVFIHEWPPDSHINEPHNHRAHAFIGKVVGKLMAGSDAAEIGWFTLEETKRLRLTGYTETILNHLVKNRMIL